MSLQLTPRIRDAMVKAAAQAFGVTAEDVLVGGRTTRIAHARHYAMWLLRELDYSSLEIGRALNRDHATVLYGAARHEARYGWSLAGQVAA